VIPPGLQQKLLMIIALTMLITPLLFIIFDLLSKNMRDHTPKQEPDKIDEEGPIIIAGIGRFGQIVNRLVQASGFKTVVLDTDMETIQLMRRFGYKGFLGDPTRPELLKAAGLAKAKVLVAAMDDAAEVTKLVAYARRQRPELHIVARAYDRTHVYELYQAGASDIVREMFDGSLRAGRYVLENVGLSEFEAAGAEQTFYHHDRGSLRELAALWKPGVPASENPEYIERSNKLQRDLETALVELAEEHAKKSA
jgi:CPA2 family monovalent cation:H+ antiporter-2